MDWTPDQIEDLTRLWNVDGLTAMEIARRMGISRSAIAGKVRRLGLAVRRTDERRRCLSEDERADRRRKANRMRAERQRKKRTTGKKSGMTSSITTDTPSATPLAPSTDLIPFALLSKFSNKSGNQCRYIPGEGPEFFACGAPTAAGESWCDHCKGIVYSRVEISDEERARRVARAKRAFGAFSSRFAGLPGEAV